MLINVDATQAGTLVQGTIDYPTDRHVRIEFFSSPGCDESGHGEGQTPLGALTLTGSGHPAAFSARVAAAPAGHVITATATDLNIQRTSEFSRCASLPAAPPPPPEPPNDPPPGSAPGDPPPTTTSAGVPGIVVGPLPGDDPPPPPRCEVPKLKGQTLAKAKRRLKRAGCKVGKVKKPRRPQGKGWRRSSARAERPARSTILARPSGSRSHGCRRHDASRSCGSLRTPTAEPTRDRRAGW